MPRDFRLALRQLYKYPGFSLVCLKEIRNVPDGAFVTCQEVCGGESFALAIRQWLES
jgi:hypothetical protein